MKNIIIYILSAISIILVIITGVIIIDYSIKHPYAGSKKIEVNKPVSALKDIGGVLFIKGWSSAEPTHRWTESKRSHIAFDIIQKIDSCHNYTIDFYPVHVMDECQEVRLFLNNKDLGDFRFCISDTIFSIPIKSDFLFFDRTNTLILDIPNAHRPDNPADQRILGIAIKQIMLSCSSK